VPARFYQPFQWLMICDKNEWVSMQITPKMNYSPYYKGIPLHRVLLGFIIIVGAIGVCHYYSKTQHVPIYIQLEWPSPNGSTQDWSKIQWNLFFLKFMFLFFFPLPFLIHFCQLNPWSSKIDNKVSILNLVI
jgi:hypothetical protein